MVAVRGHAVAAVKRIAQHRTPAQCGHGDEEIAAICLNAVEQVEERDTGLNDRVCELVVNLLDGVHTAQIEYHLIGGTWRCATVAEVLATRDGPQRCAGLVG